MCLGLSPEKPEFMASSKRMLEEDLNVTDLKTSKTTLDKNNLIYAKPRGRKRKTEIILGKDCPGLNCGRKSYRLANKSVSLLDLLERNCCRQRKNNYKVSSSCNRNGEYCRRKSKHSSPEERTDEMFCQTKRQCSIKNNQISSIEQSGRQKRKYTRSNKILSNKMQELDESFCRKKKKYMRIIKTQYLENRQVEERLSKKKRKYTRRNKTSSVKDPLLDFCRKNKKNPVNSRLSSRKKRQHDNTSKQTRNYKKKVKLGRKGDSSCRLRKPIENCRIQKQEFQTKELSKSFSNESRKTRAHNFPSGNNLKISNCQKPKQSNNVSRIEVDPGHKCCRLTVKSKTLQNRLTFSEDNFEITYYKLNIQHRNGASTAASSEQHGTNNHAEQQLMNYENYSSPLESTESVILIKPREGINNGSRNIKIKKSKNIFPEDSLKEFSCKNVSKSFIKSKERSNRSEIKLDGLKSMTPQKMESNTFIQPKERKQKYRKVCKCSSTSSLGLPYSEDEIERTNNKKFEGTETKLSSPLKRRKTCSTVVS